MLCWLNSSDPACRSAAYEALEMVCHTEATPRAGHGALEVQQLSLQRGPTGHCVTLHNSDHQCVIWRLVHYMQKHCCRSALDSDSGLIYVCTVIHTYTNSTWSSRLNPSVLWHLTYSICLKRGTLLCPAGQCISHLFV